MIEVKAPERIGFEAPITKVFLAGSIEMGKAEKWQDRLARELADKSVVLYNPRRDDWDSSWVQDPTPGTQFHEQVNWELEHIDKSDFVIFYFDPNTQSPITLMELGYVIGQNKKCMVCCPDGYFRKGNVVITLQKSNNFQLFNEIEDLIFAIKQRISDM